MIIMGLALYCLGCLVRFSRLGWGFELECDKSDSRYKHRGIKKAGVMLSFMLGIRVRFCGQSDDCT